MKKYKIPVNIVFSGYVEVKVRDKEEAAKIAVENFHAQAIRFSEVLTFLTPREQPEPKLTLY